MKNIILLSILIILLSSFLFVPTANAAIADPDIKFEVTGVNAYRNAVELGDQLYIIYYNIDYTVNPTEGTTEETYICRLMNGAAEIASSVPYAGGFSDGYSEGVISIYVSSADVVTNALTWPYTAAPAWTPIISLEGNPLQSWSSTPPPSKTVNGASFVDWFDDSTVEATQEALGARIRYIAGKIEDVWGFALLESIGGVNKLTDAGEAYFTSAIPNLRILCPNLFSNVMFTPDFSEELRINDLYTPSNASLNVFGVNWYAQTFVASESYPLIGIQLNVLRLGTPGNITIAIRDTAVGGEPTGADLTSSTVSANTYETWTSGNWESVYWTADYDLTKGTRYAIVVRVTAGDAVNYVGWRDFVTGAYTSGAAWSSGDSGATWAAVANTDFAFVCNGFQAKSSSYLDKMRNRLLGTPFDMTNLGNALGISRMWISTIIWLAASFALGYFVCKGSVSFKPMLMVIFLMLAPGAYMGFIEPLIAIGMGFLLGIGGIYVFAYKPTQ